MHAMAKDQQRRTRAAQAPADRPLKRHASGQCADSTDAPAELLPDLWLHVAAHLHTTSDLNTLLRCCKSINQLRASQNLYAERLVRTRGKAEALVAVCKRGMASALGYLLGNALVDATDLNMRLPPGDNLLYVACHGPQSHIKHCQDLQGYVGVARILLDSGCDVNYCAVSSWVPLWVACNAGHVPLVDLLLRVPGVDVDTASVSAQTPLHMAVIKGHLPVLALLLARGGGDVNARDASGRTPLWWACQGGKTEAVEKLLAAPGIDYRIPTSDLMEETPLHVAAAWGYAPVVTHLLRAAAGDLAFLNAPNKHGCTAFWVACAYGRVQVVELLLGVPGVDVRTLGKDHHSGETELTTPLRAATARGHQGVKELLMQRLNLSSATPQGQRA